MASCIAVNPDNSLSLDTLTPVSDCAYILISNADYIANANLSSLFNEFFAFDPVLFSIITSACLIAFISGFVLDMLVTNLRRV